MTEAEIAEQIALVCTLQDLVADESVSDGHRERARKALEEEDLQLQAMFAEWEEETGR